MKAPESAARPPPGGRPGAEGLAFIPASRSPDGMPLPMIGSEVSGTTTLVQVAPAF